MSDDPVYYNGYWYHNSNAKNLFKLNEETDEDIEEKWKTIREKIWDVAERNLTHIMVKENSDVTESQNN